jgi:hypothetical protein
MLQHTTFTTMKTLHRLLAALMVLAASHALRAQTITCDWFTITGIEPDTLNLDNTLITIQMLGGFSDFITYPQIASVTDCTGDTVASGELWFFGQLGGTSQGYPVSLLEDDVCLPLTIEFVYGNDLFENDTCLLTFDGSVLCDLFTITGIESDSLNPSLSNIHIQMAGDPFDQINYPQILTVQDCNSDTISTGIQTFFGQLGQTTLGYPVSLLDSSICFPITVAFFYGSIDDVFPNGTTCLLTFDSPGLAVPHEKANQFSVFPNPTSNAIQLSHHESMAGKVYGIFDVTGGLVLSGRLLDTNPRIELSALPVGVYVLMVEGMATRVIKR